MDCKILFTDLDGTLLNDEKEITPGNQAAIQCALEAGRRIVVASGRPLSSALAQAGRVGLAGPGCFVIAYNGAVIYDCTQQDVIYRQTLATEDLYAVADEAERRGLYIQTYDQEQVVIERRCEPDVARRYCAGTGMTFREIGSIRQDLPETPVKALLIDFKHRAPLERMEAWIHSQLAGRVDCFFSSRYYLEVVPPGISKGAAVRSLCCRLEIPIGCAVAAGDEANDITMLRAAGVGVAMANAVPEAKAAADYVTERDNNQDAIAEVIHRFLL